MIDHALSNKTRYALDEIPEKSKFWRKQTSISCCIQYRFPTIPCSMLFFKFFVKDQNDIGLISPKVLKKVEYGLPKFVNV